MSTYVSAETMFFLSLKPEQRTFAYDLIEEVVKMRSEGLNSEEIESRLDDSIRTIEGWTTTPRIVRRLILGMYDVQ